MLIQAAHNYVHNVLVPSVQNLSSLLISIFLFIGEASQAFVRASDASGKGTLRRDEEGWLGEEGHCEESEEKSW